jgi:mRNA interferase YafO
MKVFITEILREALIAQGDNPDLLMHDFLQWKKGSAYSSIYFGKDGAYISPKVDGLHYVLKHVHLIPLEDKRQLAIWYKKFHTLSVKTSDRHLVYVDDGRDNYLLIYILSEPSAHQIARMSNQADRNLMQKFATIAADFIVQNHKHY